MNKTFSLKLKKKTLFIEWFSHISKDITIELLKS